MAVMAALPRPGLAAQRKSLSLPWPELVEQLTETLGRKLVAYIAGKKDVRAVDRWIAGGSAYRDVEARLRFTFHVVGTLLEHDSAQVVQAWLVGVNPELGDRVPIRMLRDGDPDVIGSQILAAVRAYIAGA